MDPQMYIDPKMNMVTSYRQQAPPIRPTQEQNYYFAVRPVAEDEATDNDHYTNIDPQLLNEGLALSGLPVLHHPEKRPYDEDPDFEQPKPKRFRDA